MTIDKIEIKLPSIVYSAYLVCLSLTYPIFEISIGTVVRATSQHILISRHIFDRVEKLQGSESSCPCLAPYFCQTHFIFLGFIFNIWSWVGEFHTDITGIWTKKTGKKMYLGQVGLIYKLFWWAYSIFLLFLSCHFVIFTIFTESVSRGAAIKKERLRE